MTGWDPPKCSKSDVSSSWPVVSSIAMALLVRDRSGFTAHGLFDSSDAVVVIASVLRQEGSTGVHTHVRHLMEFMQQRGMRASLVTPFSWGGPLTYPVFGARLGIERISTSGSVVWYRRWHEEFLYRALRRELARHDNAVIYAQGPVEARAALRARRAPQQRVIMAAHYFESQSEEWVIKRQITRGGRVYEAIRGYERQVISELDSLVLVSNAARSALLDWLPEAREVPNVVIPNFVFPSAASSCDSPSGDLVTVGGLEAWKNQSYLLQILAAAKKAGSNLTLDIYGDGPCRGELMRLSEELGLGSQVRFQGYRRDVRERLPAYRVYVHASLVESLPLSIIEAMAAGLPVLAGLVGGTAELISDSVEGYFWPLDDAEKGAEILLGLLGSESQRAAMGAASEERFRRTLQADVVAPRLIDLLLNSHDDIRVPSEAKDLGGRDLLGAPANSCVAVTEHLRLKPRQGAALGFSPFARSSASNVQELFYDDAIDYAAGSPHLGFKPLYDRLVNILVEAVVDLSDRGLALEVLEVGAGHGGFTESMLAAGCCVTALEMSRSSVDRLQKRFGTNTSFQCLYNPTGGFECLQSSDFSMATFVSVLHHIPDYVGALREVITRVRPGGSLVALQEPLWYPTLDHATHRMDRIGYFSWRLRQGSLRQGMATQIRRRRGIYDEDNPADMIEYHIVRKGVDQQILLDLLGQYFKSVRLVRYWSNQSIVFQKLGQSFSLENTFGIVASDRRA